MDDKILFTPAAVLDFLSQIPEFEGQAVSMAEGPDTVQISIGDNLYNIETTNATEIPVEDEVVEQVEQADAEAFEEISSDEFAETDTVEGGIIGELAKTLLIGGLVRLSNKYMSKDQFDAYAQQAQKWRN